MFDSFSQTLLRLSLRDQVFLIVALAIGVLLALSVVFALATLLYRFRSERRRGRRARLKEALEPLILDVMAGAAPDRSVQSRVGRGEGAYFIDVLIEYAHTVRGEELHAVRRLARPHLDLAARHVLHASAERRARAVQSLATLAFVDYEDVILQALDDPSPMVAFIAARALAEQGGERHARPILDRLDRFDLWSASYLAEMLASMGREALPRLGGVYLDEGAPPPVRAVAADAIRQIGDPGGADLASRVLEGSAAGSAAAREVAIASLRILADVGQREHLPLCLRFADHEDAAVRALAASAMGVLGGPAEVPRLLAALDDESRWVAVHAARALKSLAAIDELERIAASATSGDRAALASEVLAE